MKIYKDGKEVKKEEIRMPWAPEDIMFDDKDRFFICEDGKLYVGGEDGVYELPEGYYEEKV